MSAAGQTVLAMEQPGRVLSPAFVGGLAAASLDAASAFLTFGWDMPRAIAGGLLGASAFQGGVGVWVLLGPFTAATLRHDMIMLMLLVGIPISLSFRLLSVPAGMRVSS